MITNQESLIQLLNLVDEIWVEPETEDMKRRGARRRYSQLSLFKVHVVNVCKHLWAQRSMWRLLEKNKCLREACGLAQVPDRRTLDRRLLQMGAESERQIAALGLTLVLEGVTDGLTGSGDGTPIEALGSAWQRKDQKEGVLPKQSKGVDLEAAWIYSGYHGLLPTQYSHALPLAQNRW